MLAQEIIRVKRDGGALDEAQIGAFVTGLMAAGAKVRLRHWRWRSF